MRLQAIPLMFTAAALASMPSIAVSQRPDPDAAAGRIRTTGEPTRAQLLRVLQAQPRLQDGGDRQQWYTVIKGSCARTVAASRWHAHLVQDGVADTVAGTDRCTFRVRPDGATALARDGWSKAPFPTLDGDTVYYGTSDTRRVTAVTEIMRNGDQRVVTFAREAHLSPIGEAYTRYGSPPNAAVRTPIATPGQALFVRTDTGWRLAQVSNVPGMMGP